MTRPSVQPPPPPVVNVPVPHVDHRRTALHVVHLKGRNSSPLSKKRPCPPRRPQEDGLTRGVLEEPQLVTTFGTSDSVAAGIAQQRLRF